MLYHEMLMLQNKKESIVQDMDKLKNLLAERAKQLEDTMEEITKLSKENGITIEDEEES